MTRARLLRFVVPATIAGIFAGVFLVVRDRVQIAGPIPGTIADTVFWRMMTTMSEPGGSFRSDNFVSNEAAFQYVIPPLQRRVRAGGVYIGVGPDQNFTYLVAFRPRIAFIVDIRRQNAMEHLMYKALIETSTDRAEFLSRLFSRSRPEGLDSNSSVAMLMAAYADLPPTVAVRDSAMALIVRHLRATHGFPLSDEDVASIALVHGAFYDSGPELAYTSNQQPPGQRGAPTRARFGGMRGFGGVGPIGGPAMRGMPTYAWLMEETDATGAQRSYLASEENFRALQRLERRNLVVPLVGDFAGPKTLRSVGRWLRAHDATVSEFYTSNVEQYLYQQGSDWSRFFKNVATLPIDSTSTFIRSASNRMAARAQNPNSRMVQLVMPIRDVLDAFRAGRLGTYGELVAMSR